MAMRVKLVVFEGVPYTTGVCTRSSKPSQCFSTSKSWSKLFIKVDTIFGKVYEEDVL